jgi:hypothetical protein
MGVVCLPALNSPSTASAADRCLRFGSESRPPQALVVARQGADLERAVERGTQDAHGPVVLHASSGSCALTFVVAPPTDGPFGRLWVDGWRGTISSSSTRVPALVTAADVTDAVRGSDVLKPGGDADVEELADRLDSARDARLSARVALVVVLLVLALVAPRRALMAGAAGVASALVLSALGWTSIVLFVLLTLLGSLAPRRALWVFFAAYLLVLVAWPEGQSLALIGPHPDKGGRFYGVTNETETLLLAPALLLGLAAAPLVIACVAWSRAGADGGGALVFLSAYATSAIRRTRDAVVAAGAVVLLALVLVGIDAATGGSSHVTRTIGDGPGAWWDTATHRWSASWDDATATTARTILNVFLLGSLVWIATRRPRVAMLDAFLVGIAVSLLVNDTPHDVLLWGSLQALALRRAR